MTNKKICKKCNEPLPLSAFTASSCGKYGVVAVCKECRARKYRIEYRTGKGNVSCAKAYANRCINGNAERVRAYAKCFRCVNATKHAEPNKLILWAAPQGTNHA